MIRSAIESKTETTRGWTICNRGTRYLEQTASPARGCQRYGLEPTIIPRIFISYGTGEQQRCFRFAGASITLDVELRGSIILTVENSLWPTCWLSCC